MNERLKELRKALKLTQRQLGERLGIGDTAVSKIEKGDNTLTEQNIKLICKEFRVSESWLRTGDGEMFDPDPQAEIMDFIGQLMHDNEDSFKQRFIATLAKLREDDWKVLERIANELAKKEGDA